MQSSQFSKYNDWSNRDGQLEIDVDIVLEYLKRKLRSRGIYLSDNDIKSACSDLEEAANAESSQKSGVTPEDRVVKMMKNRLDQDLKSDGSQGLHQSRSRFLTLCFVARHTQWESLAKTLLKFFEQEETDVIAEEQTFLLTEWCLGLQQLVNLVPKDKLDGAFRQVASLGPPMFEEWRRPGPQYSWVIDLLRFFQETTLHDHVHGRIQLQPSSNHDATMRRTSVLGYRRPFSIEVPAFSRTGYNTPILPPRISCEMNALYWQQQAQAFHLESLMRDFDNTRYRY